MINQSVNGTPRMKNLKLPLTRSRKRFITWCSLFLKISLILRVTGGASWEMSFVSSNFYSIETGF